MSTEMTSENEGDVSYDVMQTEKADLKKTVLSKDETIKNLNEEIIKLEQIIAEKFISSHRSITSDQEIYYEDT